MANATNVLAHAKKTYAENGLASALVATEKWLKDAPNDSVALSYHIDLLREKVEAFDESNQNHQHAQRQLVNACHALVAILPSMSNRKMLINALEKLAKLEDTPMGWVAYREACEAFLQSHATAIDSDYAEVLQHYANAFSYGVLQAFKAKRSGKDYDKRMLNKISAIEREMAENDSSQYDHIARLLAFVRARQLPFEFVEVAENNVIKKAPFILDALAPFIEQLHFFGFESRLIARDKRLEKSLSNQQPIPEKFFFVLQRGATFATLSVEPKNNPSWFGKLLKKWREAYDVDVTLTTFFTDDVVIKSLNKGESARHDAPKGYLVKCRGYDVQAQFHLHEQHVDELERRIDVVRLKDLSIAEFISQEEKYANLLLAYKKSHGFMNFSEYHRATNVESRLSYSLILDGLAQRIGDEGAFWA